MTSLLSRIATLVGRRPRVASLAVLLALLAVLGSAIAIGGTFKDDFTVPGIESQRAQDLLEQRFPAHSGTQATLVFRSDGGGLARPGTTAVRSALDAIERQPHVVAVEDPFTAPGHVSADGATAFAVVDYDQTATDLDGSARVRLERAT